MRSRSRIRVLDPFVGSGTTVLAAQCVGVEATGVEAHPFVRRIASAKLLWSLPTKDVTETFAGFGDDWRSDSRPDPGDVPGLLERCFEPECLAELLWLREAHGRLPRVGGAHELVWLAITSILRRTSFAGTAQWQYLLPNRRKAKTVAPRDALERAFATILDDMSLARAQGWRPSGCVLLGDSRAMREIDSDSVDLLITSPPYANNYDYADATRLEMTFWGEVSRWADLHSRVRSKLVTSCSQHAAKEKLKLDELLSAPELTAVAEELAPICLELAEVRRTRGGKKHYHTMAAAYFRDLSLTFGALRRVCREGSKLCLVVGDSAPYGVHIPVERLLGELAVAAGFGSFAFEKVRDRNVKWKNRKHRVPLQEGRLWIDG